MSALQATINDTPKQFRSRLLLKDFLILIGLGAVTYYSYCFGLWGRNSLFLQYLFQCGCPSLSEEWRYPEEVDVIVSACPDNFQVILSPSGRLLYVQQDRINPETTYLLNLETGKKTAFVLPEGSNYFLTDSLVFHSFYGDNEYVLDVKTGRQYPIKRFAKLHSEAYTNGELNLDLLAEELRKVKNVFLIDNDIIIALASEEHISPEQNFLTGWFDIPGSAPDRLEQFLQEHEITYSYIPDAFLLEDLSIDGRFIARDNGIYLSKTNQLIVKAHISGLKGWIYDGHGAIYTSNPCLFWLGWPGLGVACPISVSQPVILLKVPEEYLLSTP